MALGATVGLTAFKFGVGLVSGSVGVLSEAIHSFLDLISASVSYFTIRASGKPADEDHPYGHGKIETLSSLFESLLLVAAAVWMVIEGIEHIHNPHPIEYQWLAITVIAVSLVVSYIVYRHNSNAAEVTESSAIQVNALHFFADVIASAAVLAGLVLLKFTGWLILDALLAFVVAGYVLLLAFQQVRKATRELTDVQLPDSEIHAIQKILGKFKGKILEAHDLRTRRSGATRHIDFHMVVCGEMTVNESHAVCDEIEEKISAEFPTASVNIHVEPCRYHKNHCHVACESRDYWRKRQSAPEIEKDTK